jgi:copper transport protein
MAPKAGPSFVVPALLVLGVLALPATALAHASLVRAQPADGSVVETAPPSIRLTFDDAIRTQPGVRAVDASGSSVLGGQPRLVGRRTLVIPVRSDLRRGGYTVLWRVLSDDGHQVAGVTTFAVGAGQPRPRPALTAASERRAVPGVERWVFLSGVLLAVGLSLFRIAMPRAAAPSLRLLCVGFALSAGGGAALVARTSLGTRFGLVVAIAVAVAVAGLLAALAAGFVPRLAVGAWTCGLALVAAPSASGHALDPERSRVELPIDVLHVAASSVWFGGAVALAVGARHGALRESALRRFSALALLSVGVIGVTGVVRAFSELSSVGQVIHTSYGRLLLVKTALLTMLVAFGWTNRYRLIPTLSNSERRLRLNLRAEALLLVAVIGAVALLTQTRPGRDHVLVAPAAAANAQPSATPEEAVVLAQDGRDLELAGQAANALSVDGRSVMWETVPDEGGSSALVERSLDSRRTRVLVRNVAPLYGLAATTASIVYATGTTPTHLVALNGTSGRRIVLTASLAAPFAWRGERVAWAEERDGRQRVVVYDLRRHARWTAADLPVCAGPLCYRIDGITLARRGVVFARSAVGTQPSFVVRRAFAATRPESVKVERDPQPDLVPSATGAAYYALDRGWYRWNFGSRRPLLLRRFPNPSQYPISYDGRRWLLLQHRGCNDTVVEQLESGRLETFASTARALTVAGVRTRVCVRFQGLTTAGAHPVTTWLVLPLESHAAGATGVIEVGGKTQQ